jgi:hypothetical protein
LYWDDFYVQLVFLKKKTSSFSSSPVAFSSLVGMTQLGFEFFTVSAFITLQVPECFS